MHYFNSQGEYIFLIFWGFTYLLRREREHACVHEKGEWRRESEERADSPLTEEPHKG